MAEPRINYGRRDHRPPDYSAADLLGPLYFTDIDGESFQVGFNNSGHLEVMCRPTDKIRQRHMVLVPHVSNVVIIRTVEDQ